MIENRSDSIGSSHLHLFAVVIPHKNRVFIGDSKLNAYVGPDRSPLQFSCPLMGSGEVWKYRHRVDTIQARSALDRSNAIPQNRPLFVLVGNVNERSQSSSASLGCARIFSHTSVVGCTHQEAVTIWLKLPAKSRLSETCTREPSGLAAKFPETPFSVSPATLTLF